MATAQLSIKPRRSERFAVDFPVIAERRRLDDRALRIVNVSFHGFMADGVSGLGLGERLSVRLPVVGAIEAHVAWIHGERAGFQFERIVRGCDFAQMLAGMHARRGSLRAL